MEYLQAGKIKKQTPNHKASVSTQTGFPSPATHYLEPSIDLNKELIPKGTVLRLKITAMW